MYGLFFKRTIDVAAAATVLLLISPLLLLVAALIKLEDGGPVLFRQTRVGRGGGPFIIYKFRSMPVGTPNLPSAVAGELKLTRVGRVIRRTNVDELPQLWNILKGDMSLIGPRPALPSQESLVTLRRQSGIGGLRPGLTGLAQVNSYDGMPEVEKVDWDTRYARSMSFAKDCAIVLRTFVYLLKRPPAY